MIRIFLGAVTFTITTFSLSTILSIMGLIAAISTNDTQHKGMLLNDT